MAKKKPAGFVSWSGQSSGRICGAILVATVAVVLLACAVDDAIAQSGPKPTNEAPPSNAPLRPAPSKALGHLIEKLRQNEALYKNFDLTIRSTTKYVSSTKPNQMPAPIAAFESKTRSVVSGDRLRFTVERTTTLSSGKKLSERRMSVCDGSQTVSIVVGNSVTIDQGRYEPSGLLPPHTLPLSSFGIKFPLSIYLQGAQAIGSHPKVARAFREYQMHEDAIDEYNVNRVDAEVIGEETVDGLECVKVRALSWFENASPPRVEYFWLAKQRNYHVALWRTAQPGNGHEIPKREGRTTRWLELADGVWLPAAVHVKELSPEVVPGSFSATSPPLLQPEYTMELTVARATLDPRLPEGFFRAPAYSASLPVFTFDEDGRLIKGPMLPMPVKAEQKTTLAAIVKRLTEEEKKYDRYEVVTGKRHKGHMNTAVVGSPTQDNTRQRTVVIGNRFFQQRDETFRYAASPTQMSRITSAFDGRWTRRRERARLLTKGSRTGWDTCASLHVGSYSVDLFRPHTILLYESMWPSLSVCLTSGWDNYYERDNRFTIEYLGDERVGELYCHKIKRGNSCLWLARDRNLLPVREEGHLEDPRVKLPCGVTCVDRLREIRPGLWFPERTTHMSFEASDLFENRLVVSWREDMQVDELVTDPKVDDSLFTTVEVPAGIRVSVDDENDESIGEHQQQKTGNIDVSPSELAKMREAAGHKR